MTTVNLGYKFSLTTVNADAINPLGINHYKSTRTTPKVVEVKSVQELLMSLNMVIGEINIASSKLAIGGASIDKQDVYQFESSLGKALAIGSELIERNVIDRGRLEHYYTQALLVKHLTKEE